MHFKEIRFSSLLWDLNFGKTYISDTSEQLHLKFSTFQNLQVDYVLPATITLFGQGKADSKTLMLNAIRKHYPELEVKYEKFFKTNSEMPKYYQEAFYKKMKELCNQYKLNSSILEAAQLKN